jgi:UDP-N-acetylmuramate--alanine ligase
MNIHFIGIGGSGMNGVAQLAAHAGHRVTGSDRTENPELFRYLKNLDIGIFLQNGSGITENTDYVIYSTAIESDNPDIVRARERGIPLLHRADMLAKLCEGKEIIAVAGSAGKSTVTGLLGWIFEQLGLDPTVYCGAPILNWKTTPSTCRAGTVENVGSRSADLASRPAAAGRASPIPALQKMRPDNVRFGSGPWIIEADESDRSFLTFHPNHAVITNIAEDHFELSELKQLFAQFESQVSGIVIKPDPPRPSATPPERGFISSPDSPPSEGWPQAGVGSLLIGNHNTENIQNALRLCKSLGLDMNKCIEAVHTFKGMERRLERHGPKVIDDFAHSPAKIAAALDAVSEVWPAFSIVWRPHGYTPLFQGLEGFIEVFSAARASAKFFILPVYYAGGTVDKKITSEEFVGRLKTAGVPAEFVPDFHALEKRLLEESLPVLIMGARDPDLPRFAQKIAAVIG